ncbi:DUF3040 domain-containing protein [Arthrobacter sp. NPDC080073]|uniref:DUF3040 domain-containing protein n=1 Tax=Arthrobacter sp. NPDC080073 TaxID=3155919 RepID=UPI00341F11A9
MALSEYERRRLQALEADLAAQDPALARELATGTPSGLWLRKWVGAFVALGGIGLLILGIAVHVPVLGILGFVLMICGACGYPRRRLAGSGPGQGQEPGQGAPGEGAPGQGPGQGAPGR